ncbi:hypothetical protein [Methylobacterium radiodurans]|nr:hypothetical protein [Methylobacterium radiodurans]
MRMPGQGRETGGWSLAATPVADGVRLELGLADLGGAPATAIITLDRSEARAFARALLAAAGDAAERTFTPPPERD